MIKALKETTFIISLIAITLLLNSQIIYEDIVFPEQFFFYWANTKVNNFSDFLNIYLHPKMMHAMTPFFRPSGHILIYQLLIPLLGWYNTRGLLIINLIFLALIGYLVLKIYRFLFPTQRLGGYIAFGFYMMHPLLIYPRMISMHFEFAYVFFVLLSLYTFLLFCESFKQSKRRDALLLFSLCMYCLAVSFKESALMLGPILGIYFLSHVTNVEQIFRRQHRDSLKIFLTLFTLSLCLAIYMILSWPYLKHPVNNAMGFNDAVFSLKRILLYLFYAKLDPGQFSFYEGARLPWCNPLFTWLSRIVIVALMWTAVFMAILIFTNILKIKLSDKKNLLFLYCATMMFLILPIFWAAAQPWHLSLSILFFGIIIGFTYDFIFVSQSFYKKITPILMVIFAYLTYAVNSINIHNYLEDSFTNFILSLNRNSIYHAPPLKNISNSSTVIIELTNFREDYLLGGSMYPLVTFSEHVRDTVFNNRNHFLIKTDSFYNADLFKWGYNLPGIKEELYPFFVSHMEKVPDLIIHSWYKAYPDIYALGYTKTAEWVDKTTQFRTNLVHELKKRGLKLYHYKQQKLALGGNIKRKIIFKYGSVELCQFMCDQDNDCKGYVYFKVDDPKTLAFSLCHFYLSIDTAKQMPCSFCSSFTKLDSVNA